MFLGTDLRKMVVVQKLMLLALLMLGICGCETFHTHHLSKSEVLGIAQRVALEHGENLQEYQAPRLLYVRPTGEWIVSFELKTPPTLGDPRTYHAFAVHVSDKTGNARYKECGWF